MPRGRARDLEAHDRILDATFALLSSPERCEVRIDDIAAAANVGKQTIYRWWPSRDAVAIDALLRGTMNATPFNDTGDTKRDLGDHLRKVARLFSSPTGSLIKNVVGDAQRNTQASEDFIKRFWNPRRELSKARLQRGIESGQVRPDIDIELCLDALYGPLWTRLIFGHLQITPKVADQSLALIWPQLADPNHA
jgi:AcrR family transcriptional regulator